MQLAKKASTEEYTGIKNKKITDLEEPPDVTTDESDREV